MNPEDREELARIALTNDGLLGRLAGVMWITRALVDLGDRTAAMWSFLPHAEGGPLEYITEAQATQLFRWLIRRIQQGLPYSLYLVDDPIHPTPYAIQWVGADVPLILPTVASHYEAQLAPLRRRIVNRRLRGEDVTEELAEEARLVAAMAALSPEDEAT